MGKVFSVVISWVGWLRTLIRSEIPEQTQEHPPNTQGHTRGTLQSTFHGVENATPERELGWDEASACGGGWCEALAPRVCDSSRSMPVDSDADRAYASAQTYDSCGPSDLWQCMRNFKRDLNRTRKCIKHLKQATTDLKGDLLRVVEGKDMQAIGKDGPHCERRECRSWCVCDSQAKSKKMSGRVRWFDEKFQYGFIEKHDNKGDIFVHGTNIVTYGLKGLKRFMTALKPGEEVDFTMIKGKRGDEAIQLTRKGVTRQHYEFMLHLQEMVNEGEVEHEEVCEFLNCHSVTEKRRKKPRLARNNDKDEQ